MLDPLSLDKLKKNVTQFSLPFIQCLQVLLIHALCHQLPIRWILPPHHILVNQVLIGPKVFNLLEILTLFTILSYHCISPIYFSFVSSLSSITIPKNVQEALDHPSWRQAMIVEMQALENSGTWDLVPVPPRKKTIDCIWVYAVKVGPNGEVDQLKARLVVKGYT